MTRKIIDIKIRSAKLAVLLIAFLSLSLPALSQHSTSSPYSRYGIGERIQGGFGMNQALGGTGIGMRALGITDLNPAANSALRAHSFIFDIGMSYKYSISESNAFSEENIDSNIDYLALGFPVTDWWFASAGLSPYSTVGYEVSNEYAFENGTGISKYDGAGGINRFYIGNSFLFFKHLSVGFNLSYMFGSMEQNSLSYVNETAGSATIEETNQTTVNDFYLDYGVQYTQVFNKKYALTLGMVFSNRTELKAQHTDFVVKRFSYNQNLFVDTLVNVEGEEKYVEIPTNWGIGASFRIGSKLLFAADYYQQDWSEAVLMGETAPELTQSSGMSFGVQYMPEAGSHRLVDNMRFRLGMHYDKTYLKLNEEQITDYGLSFGIGVPLRTSQSLINVLFEVGQRGTKDNNLVRDTYFKAGLSLTLHDLWFIQRKFD